MKNKFLRYTFLGAVAAGVLGTLTACHDIAEEDRFIKLPTIEPLDNQRAVLLEEFTGQECVNCPGAHTIIKGLHQQFPETFIPVAIHAGEFAWQEKWYGEDGFGVEEGEKLAKARGVVSYPSGIMDRASTPHTASEWAGDLRTRLGVPATVEIEMATEYLPVSRELKITTTLVSDELSGGKLQLWVIENNLVGYQILLDGSEVEDYVHNHVFRGTVNGLEGTAFTIEPSTDPMVHASAMLEHTLTLKDHWTVENLQIVAIVDNNGAVENTAIVDALSSSAE